MPFNIKSSGSYYATFDDSPLSANRTYRLPNESGTIITSAGTASYATTAVTASYALTSAASTSGTSGTSGAAGTSGTSGAAGTSGTSGAAGTSGTTGTSGTSGANGTSGTSGANGTSGTSGTGFSTIYAAAVNRVLFSDGTTNAASASSAITVIGSDATVSGSLFVSGTIVDPVLISYEERVVTPSISAGTLTLNLASGSVFEVTISAAVNTFSISNPPKTSNAGSLVLVTIGSGTPWPFQWGSAVTWSGGTAPSITSTTGKKDIYGFISTNQGTNWYGFIGGQNL